MKPAARPVMIPAREGTAAELLERARLAEKLGADQIWLAQEPDERDSTIVAGAYLQAAPSAAVGISVLPAHARHPVAVAQSALTLADFSGGRFILGLGISHQYVNEHVLGVTPGPPIEVMRDYLTIVRTLIDDGAVAHQGRHFTAHAQYVGPRQPVPLYVAALRPRMIRLAVEFGDGIALWLCSPRYVREQVRPVIEQACADFGKDPSRFQVCAILPTRSGPRAPAALENFAQTVTAYRLFPYYRHVLDAQGPVDPGQVCLIGSEDHIRTRIQEYRDAGCTPLVSPMVDTADDFEATVLAAYGADS